MHDSKLSDIKFRDNKIELYSSEGFWETSDAGKETNQLINCKLIVDFSDQNHPDRYIEIHNSKNINISFIKFQKLVRKFGLIIHDEFRSNFTRTLKIEGNADKYYELSLSDIAKITYDFDQ